MSDGLTRGEVVSLVLRLAAATTISFFTMKVRLYARWIIVWILDDKLSLAPSTCLKIVVPLFVVVNSVIRKEKGAINIT